MHFWTTPIWFWNKKSRLFLSNTSDDDERWPFQYVWRNVEITSALSAYHLCIGEIRCLNMFLSLIWKSTNTERAAPLQDSRIALAASKRESERNAFVSPRETSDITVKARMWRDETRCELCAFLLHHTRLYTRKLTGGFCAAQFWVSQFHVFPSRVGLGWGNALSNTLHTCVVLAPDKSEEALNHLNHFFNHISTGKNLEVTPLDAILSTAVFSPYHCGLSLERKLACTCGMCEQWPPQQLWTSIDKSRSTFFTSQLN